MSESIEPIAVMAQELGKLPGVGPKTAQRLAYHLASRPQEEVRALAVALWEGRKAIRFCATCGNYSTGENCRICADAERHNGQICVVRDPRDVAALERMHEYRGLYHVLHGTLSPMDGVGPDDIRIKELLVRAADESVEEVIMATNPDTEGEATAMYISRLLKPFHVKVTRLAYGIPVGSNLEFADDATLNRAIEGRTEM